MWLVEGRAGTASGGGGAGGACITTTVPCAAFATGTATAVAAGAGAVPTTTEVVGGGGGGAETTCDSGSVAHPASKAIAPDMISAAVRSSPRKECCCEVEVISFIPAAQTGD